MQGKWFRTGDLGVQHPDGRVELKDREKDIIIRYGRYRSTDPTASIVEPPRVGLRAMPDDWMGLLPPLRTQVRLVERGL